MQKSDHMVLKGVNCVYNGKLGQMVLKGVNRVTNDKNQIIWSWKDSIVHTMAKLGQMVLKGVNWVHNAKIRSYGLERTQLCTQW